MSLGLYVHVPFCARACPYCDFDFEVGRTPSPEVAAAFVAGLEAERRARGLPLGLPVRTVYVGGGTPSQLGPQGLGQLLRYLDERFDTAAAVERTVELNPEHVDDAMLDALQQAGVDRVSLGVQSLAPDALAQLGRVHEAEQALAALEAAVGRGLRVSADLIVGWPGQRAQALRADVAALLQTGVEHVSIYALTVEAGTPWEALVRRGRRREPEPEAQARRLQEAEALLTAAGLHHYEVASYARPARGAPTTRAAVAPLADLDALALARHNLAYWTGGDYVGLGPSAASARHGPGGSVERRTNLRGLARWQAEPGVAADVERLAPEVAAAEALWLGLRVLHGIDSAGFLARFPCVDLAWMRARAAAQVARGNLEWTHDPRHGPGPGQGGILRVAPGRWLWHDEIGADLLAPTPSSTAGSP